MRKVLLVGGAGYVGSVLTEELLERGYAVRILDRLYFGRRGLEKVTDRVELVIGDVRNIGPQLLDGVDGVINVGGLSNDPTAEYNPQANYEINTLATQKLAELCKKAGVRRYIFASSCSIYDRGVADQGQDVVQDETAEVNPKAAYSNSKYQAERILIEMADDNFCPVILRKGTIYGFSPRMRYDLVVNTFVKDALSRGYITVIYGGEMWRQLIDVRDVGRAYILSLEAPSEKVCGEIFNVSYCNYRISELALRVREALHESGVKTELRADYTYHGVRSYRVSGKKIEQSLGFRPLIAVEESVRDMVDKIYRYGYDDFDHPRYYNIRWMKLLEEASEIMAVTGSVFGS